MELKQQKELRKKLQDIWEVTEKNGFLPKCEPLCELPSEFEDVEQIMRRMPELIKNVKLAKEVDEKLQDHYEQIQRVENAELIVALYRDYCFLASGYSMEECHFNYQKNREYGEAKRILPKVIAQPLSYLAQIQDAKPWMDYSRSYMNFNYKKKDLSKGVTYDNLNCIRTFSDEKGEPGFILTHCAIDGYSPKVVQHIKDLFLCLASKDRINLNHHLNLLSHQLILIKDELKQMYLRNPVDSYNIFRTFMSGTLGTPMFQHGIIFEAVSPDPSFLRGPSAALDLMMPTLDRLFALQDQFPNNPLTQLLQDYKEMIPNNHKKYLEWVDSQSKQYQFIDYIKEDSQTLLLLINCIQSICQFRSTHYNFIKEYIIKREKKVIGSGGSNAISFISNQLVVAYDYIINLCEQKSQCMNKSSSAENQIEKILKENIKKKEMLLATLEHHKKSEMNSYKSILQDIDIMESESYDKLDKNDSLSHFKKEFYLSKEGVYVSAHALGPMSKKVESAVTHYLHTWKAQGINAWQEWLPLEDKVVEKLSFLLGAFQAELSISPSLTIGLHQLMSTFYKPKSNRNKILMLKSEFPSDIFCVQSWLDIHQLGVETLLMTEFDEENPEETNNILIKKIDEQGQEISLVVVSAINSYFGQMIDVKRIAQKCKQKGCLLIVDLAHSVGCVPLQLHDWNVDAAVMCSYKFLNAGAGNIGAIFIHQNHQSITPGLRGWFGTQRTHLLLQQPIFTPSTHNLNRFQISTFDPLQLQKINAALEYFLEASPNNIYAKTQDLIHYLKSLLSSLILIKILNFQSKFTGTIVIRSNLAGLSTKTIYQKISEQNVICDYKDRYDVIRLGVGALYISFQDCFFIYNVFKNILQQI